MTCDVEVVVLFGGEGEEREVSFKSAEPTIGRLKQFFNVRSIQLDANELPIHFRLHKDLIFPLIHGDFGEDGRLQYLLEQGGYAMVGSGSKASHLCINKMKSKQLAGRWGIPVLPAMNLVVGEALNETHLKKVLKSETFVLKPTDKGSSIGVHLCESFQVLQHIWSTVKDGNWMVERYVRGRELAVGILQGEPLGVVEIRPKVGFYDFNNKYTAGACDYLLPAPVGADTSQKVRAIAGKFFKRARCLDFSRADFLLEDNGSIWFLEMNTIPGMTHQSLFPKSAACCGMSFDEVLQRIIRGAIDRNRLCNLLK
ncbi:MAG: D-alanine--D-alanine ligase [Puniceicoccales bacterium]|nr:D-alanine--D-alanine ligase [Puniceicoccales bacterium]